ncbi:Pycsar system effector family protein [Bosea sp. AS-1]|uniref:Pycsar system effector family protein n=1 Tax=Bosea sp. AS-1 TaxID=2015316 RepID=UPI000B7968B4|nr:Pycsar system effector family protein [Bosea sp. AS-1]
MAKNDQQEAFERVLTSTLVRVTEFLKFAEAKNAALLTFASAWILASINLLNGTNLLPSNWKWAIAAALPLFVSGALVGIVSFLPKTLLSGFHHDPEQDKSLLYFGDAATFAPAAYKERIRTRYFPPDDQSATQSYLDDLSVQIAVNSKITRRKLRFFNAGAGLVLAALAILAIPSANTLWSLVTACGAR